MFDIMAPLTLIMALLLPFMFTTAELGEGAELMGLYSLMCGRALLSLSSLSNVNYTTSLLHTWGSGNPTNRFWELEAARPNIQSLGKNANGQQTESCGRD